MQLEALKHLYDMQQACRLLADFIAGKTFVDYSADALLRSAVERQLTIVGEALNRLKKIEPTAASSITDARSAREARPRRTSHAGPGNPEEATGKPLALAFGS
jgi:Ribonuclease HepT-like